MNTQTHTHMQVINKEEPTSAVVSRSRVSILTGQNLQFEQHIWHFVSWQLHGEKLLTLSIQTGFRGFMSSVFANGSTGSTQLPLFEFISKITSVSLSWWTRSRCHRPGGVKFSHILCPKGGLVLDQRVSGSSVLPRCAHEDRERETAALQKGGGVMLGGVCELETLRCVVTFFPLRAVIPSPPPPPPPPTIPLITPTQVVQPKFSPHLLLG